MQCELAKGGEHRCALVRPRQRACRVAGHEAHAAERRAEGGAVGEAAAAARLGAVGEGCEIILEVAHQHRRAREHVGRGRRALVARAELLHLAGAADEGLGVDLRLHAELREEAQPALARTLGLGEDLLAPEDVREHRVARVEHLGRRAQPPPHGHEGGAAQRRAQAAVLREAARLPPLEDVRALRGLRGGWLRAEARQQQPLEDVGVLQL